MTLKKGTGQDADEAEARIEITDQSEGMEVEAEARNVLNVVTVDAVEAEIDVVEITKLTVMTEKIGTEVEADKKDDQNQDPNPETENLDTSK